MDSTENIATSKEAFKMFYKKYSKTFWFFIRKTCGDESMADDIFQESFLKFFRAAPLNLNEYQLKAYLYKIAVRLIIDHKRKIKVIEKHMVENAPEERKDNDLFLSMDMQKVFKLLKPNERTLLWLAYVEGYSHKDIAVITNAKEKSIKVQLFRTRKKFAGVLKEKGFAKGEN